MEINAICKKCGESFSADPWVDDVNICKKCLGIQAPPPAEVPEEVEEVDIAYAEAEEIRIPPADQDGRRRTDVPPPAELPRDDEEEEEEPPVKRSRKSARPARKRRRDEEEDDDEDDEEEEEEEEEEEGGDILPQYLNKSKKILDEFRATDFKSELLPLDIQGVSAMAKDTSLWVVVVLGVLPLFIISINDDIMRLNGLLFFFALIWAGIFRTLILKSRESVLYPIAAFFFTGVVGIRILLAIYKILPSAYMNMSDSHDAVTSLIGYVVQVGLCEELCKLAPVVLYLMYKREKASIEIALLIGVFSGLGFAAFENIEYSKRMAIDTARRVLVGNTMDEAIGGAMFGSIAAMSTVMLRSLSLVFAHATFSGIASCFALMAFADRKRRVVLAFLALAVPSILHGGYDWFCSKQNTVAAMIIGLTFVLFYGYLGKMRRRVTESRRDGEQQ